MGRFSYHVATDTWDWDDEVYRIHGLDPVTTTPTLSLVLASKHPDDRERVRRLLERVSSDGGPFSISYRLLGADGAQRRIVLVGNGQTLEESSAMVQGYYIDLTHDFVEDAEELARQAVRASAESTALIEQAKGILMFVYGIDGASAFAMLRWWANSNKQTVREVAERLADLASRGVVTGVGVRTSLDALLHDISAAPSAS
jgi:hypothetical protein